MELFAGKHAQIILEVLNKLHIDLKIGSAEMLLPNIIKGIIPFGKVTVVGSDSDSVVEGTFIRSILVKSGYQATCLYLGDGDFSEEIANLTSAPDDSRVIVAVGDDRIINLCRYFAGKTGKKVIAVAQNPKLSGIISPFMPIFVNGIRQKAECATISALIIDGNILKRSKKHAIADSFSEVVSKCITLIDYKYAKQREGKPIQATCYNLVVESINDAINIKSERDILWALTKAQLKLSVASYIGDVLDYGGQISVAEVLFSIGQASSFYECEFVAFTRLIKLYKLYLSNTDLEIIKVPNYAYRIEQLSSALNLSQNEVESLVAISSKEELKKDKEAIQAVRDKLLKESSNTVRITERIKGFKKTLCNPRKPMNKLTAIDIKRGIILGGYLSHQKSILKLMADDGILELME